MTPVRLVLMVVIIAVLSAGLAAIVVFPTSGGSPETGFDVPESEEELPRLGDTPDWTLTASTGAKVSSADLRGTPYIVDFIFTRCKTACPLMTAHLRDIQEMLASAGKLGQIKLVSISVDPEHDRPDVLAEFKAGFGAHPQHWLFLTGDSRENVWRMVEDGYMLGLAEDPDNEAMPIDHSTRFGLVDAEGVIRGYYDSDDPEDRERLTADAIRLTQ
ncbi:MAG: SCO family protein [Phycisphaeraceae bacterium]